MPDRQDERGGYNLSIEHKGDEMRQLLFVIQYRGTHYHGYQVQQNALSVAQVIQDAVERIFGERLGIVGCSRTDTGVHANRYALTLRTEKDIPCERLVAAMNCWLPKDIAVLDCIEVPDDFHVRYHCVGKEYLYQLWNAPVRNPFLEDLAYHYPYRLDEERLDRAAKAFLGEHDFKAFCNGGSGPHDENDTIRRIDVAEVTREGPLVTFRVAGNGFLYNMVRIMTGTLLAVAEGKLSPDGIGEVIESRNRRRAGRCAPAHGLYLNRIFYPPELLLPEILTSL